MYDRLPADVRSRHPYHMYDEIMLQPEAVKRSLALVSDSGDRVAAALGRARRVFVTGCGTSFHAARAGAWFLRWFSGGKIDAHAVGALDLAAYPSGLRPDDLVMAVTHSGGTVMTVRALEQSARLGAETVAVTGVPDSAAGRAASQVIQTGYDDERSWAHTASYTAALGTMAALANTVAQEEERLDLADLPALLSDVLSLDEIAHRMAAGVALVEPAVPVILVGGGPNAGTAHEAALKLLETCYVPALAFDLEEMLHGPLAAVSERSAVILIAPAGRSTARAADLDRALHRLGVTPVVLCGQENADSFSEAHRLVLPDVPEVLSPIAYVLPLQLFSYYLAVGKGHNPDLIHRDDERQRSARGEFA